MWCLQVQNKSSLVLVLILVFTNLTLSMYYYVLLHVFKYMLNPTFIFLPTGWAGHRLGLHRLHWSHDPFPSLALLVCHVLPNVDQSGAGQHVWHYPGHPHPHRGHLQSTKGIPHRSAKAKSYYICYMEKRQHPLVCLFAYGRFTWIFRFSRTIPRG